MKLRFLGRLHFGNENKQRFILHFTQFALPLHPRKSKVMNSIEIRTVTNKRELKQFIRFYYDLYRGSKYAVPFLFFDEWNTLSRDKNPSFECCDAKYFTAWRDGKMVGRVAAIINHRANKRWNRQQVRFGWFDFVDDIEVSRALLNAVEDWGIL